MTAGVANEVDARECRQQRLRVESRYTREIVGDKEVREEATQQEDAYSPWL